MTNNAVILQKRKSIFTSDIHINRLPRLQRRFEPNAEPEFHLNEEQTLRKTRDDFCFKCLTYCCVEHSGSIYYKEIVMPKFFKLLMPRTLTLAMTSLAIMQERKLRE